MARTFKRLMEEHQVTQQQVADGTGIDKNTLSALVHGRVSKVTTLNKLATFFDVDVSSFLVGKVGAPEPETSESPLTLRSLVTQGSLAKDTLVTTVRREPRDANALHVLDAIEAAQRHLATIKEFLEGR